ncbi:hypothetical protein C8R44DRAFT_878439 [Mycena epipterygia]|nr:hypothetical protein C8R44DRAFT_878439 [Mycena epipterygia]
MSEIGQLTIPLFIGTVLNWALLGALVVQACKLPHYIYFLAFPNDRPFSKILVVSILVAELLQTLGDSRDTIRVFGAGWGNPEILDEVGWAWFSVPVLGSIIACAGQIFFAWRIYIIGNNSVYIPIVIAIVTAVQLGAGVWTGVDISRAREFSVLQFHLLSPPIVWLAGTALADLIIVSATLFYLVKARQPGFRTSTYALLSRIIKVIVETGLLCAVFALVNLYLYLAYKGNNYHLAVCIWLSKVYSNSIILILNSRAHIGHASPSNSVGGLTDPMVFRHSENPVSAMRVTVETSSIDDSVSQRHDTHTLVEILRCITVPALETLSLISSVILPSTTIPEILVSFLARSANSLHEFSMSVLQALSEQTSRCLVAMSSLQILQLCSFGAFEGLVKLFRRPSHLLPRLQQLSILNMDSCIVCDDLLAILYSRADAYSSEDLGRLKSVMLDLERTGAVRPQRNTLD